MADCDKSGRRHYFLVPGISITYTSGITMKREEIDNYLVELNIRAAKGFALMLIAMLLAYIAFTFIK